MSRSKIIASESSSSESQTDCSPKHQYSAISEHSSVRGTPQAIREWLMSLPGDSRVSRSVSRESKPERTTHGTSGLKPLRQFGLYDPGTASWRMCQDSLFQDILELSSKTYTKHGMMQDGSLWELTMSGLPIAEKGCGLWLPTPTVQDSENDGGPSQCRRNTVPLNAAVKMLPTPNATDWKGRSTRSPGKERPACDDDLPTRIGGQLNPDWVCWLMGWPIGWESLEPMKKVLWLDWSVDPADMEKPEMWPTHKSGICGMTAVCSDRPPEKSTHLTMQVHLRGRTGTGPIPRVATGIKDRVNRLKALGNGQVPLCAAAAWEILR